MQTLTKGLTAMYWLSQAARIWQALLIFPHLLHTEWGQGLSHFILRRVIAVSSAAFARSCFETYPDTAPDLSALSDQLNNYQAIILGPGLGQNAASENIVRTVNYGSKTDIIRTGNCDSRHHCRLFPSVPE